MFFGHFVVVHLFLSVMLQCSWLYSEKTVVPVRRYTAPRTGCVCADVRAHTHIDLLKYRGVPTHKRCSPDSDILLTGCNNDGCGGQHQQIA